MSEPFQNNTSSAACLSENNFKRMAAFIHTRLGIRMPPEKRIMLEGRLRKRLRTLYMDSYTQYCDYLFSPKGMDTELDYFINEVTTNKTDFFREPKHFTFLVQEAIPELINSLGAGIKRELRVWSSACSKGDEPYTLGMVLSEFAYRYPGFKFDYSILATDISTKMLNTAQKAVYDHEDIAPVSEELRAKYLLKSKDNKKALVRIAPELRCKVKFRRLNLMDKDFGLRELMDIIFCRNVFIYFDKKTQDDLIYRFCKHLNTGGYIFMGHSEVLHCKNVPLVSAAPAIYRKRG